MAPDASSRGVGRRRLGPLLGLHASRRVGDEATAKRPSTPGRCSAAGDKPAGLSWPWSLGGDRFSAASSRSRRRRGKTRRRRWGGGRPRRRRRTLTEAILFSPAAKGFPITCFLFCHTGGRNRKFFNSRPRAPYGPWRPRRLNPVNPCQTGLPGVA